MLITISICNTGHVLTPGTGFSKSFALCGLAGTLFFMG